MGKVFVDTLMCVIIAQILLFCMPSGYVLYSLPFLSFDHKTCYCLQGFFLILITS